MNDKEINEKFNDNEGRIRSLEKMRLLWLQNWT